MDITLLEPAAALESKGAYAAVAKVDDRVLFPHVDSCFAMVGILEDGQMVAGHVPQQWPGMPKPSADLCFNRMWDLLEANRKRIGGKGVVCVVTVGANNWLDLRGELWGKWQAGAALAISTDGAKGGVDVIVTRQSVQITSCNTKKTQSFAVNDDYQTEKFND